MVGIDVSTMRGYTRRTLWIWPSVTVVVALVAVLQETLFAVSKGSWASKAAPA